MTEFDRQVFDARLLMRLRVPICFDGVTYAYIKAVQIEFDERTKEYVLRYVLKDRRANSITTAPAKYCTPLE